MDTFLKTLRALSGVSERDFAVQAGVSRMTLRAVESGSGNCTLGTLRMVSKALSRNVVILANPDSECPSQDSTVAVSFKILRSGVESWPLHTMEMVDTFRKTLDPRLLLLPPDPSSEKRVMALLASIILSLCHEVGMVPPVWAEKLYWLDRPWFVSGMESLKASAILESPLFFRRNNIYVLENFLQRA